MSNQSIIEHKANMFYVEFREDYLAICLACTYKKPEKNGRKSKASHACKALILAISESWTNQKRGHGDDLSFYMTYPQWVDAMYGMFGRNVVIDSVDELIGEKLLSRTSYRLHGKDTFRYTYNYAEINRRMKALPERAPSDTSPQVNALTSKRDEKSTDLQVNGNAFTNQPDTSLQVNEDAFTKGRNIESTNHQDIDSTQNTSARATSSPSEQKPTTPDLRGGLREYNQEIRQETAAQIKKREEMRKAEIFALYARLTGVSKVVKSKENREGADMLVDIDASDADITVAVEEIQDDPFWSKQMNLRTVAGQLQNRVSDRKKRGGLRASETTPNTQTPTTKNGTVSGLPRLNGRQTPKDSGTVLWFDSVTGEQRLMTYDEADDHGWEGGFGEYIQHTDYGDCPDTRPYAKMRQAQEMRGTLHA